MSIQLAFNGNYSSPVVNFNFLQGNVDPHPTNEGHEVIFESHITTISAITLNETSKSLGVGQSIQLTARVIPDDPITNTDVIWGSSNNNIATVDNTGKVTAAGVGQATITAATADGSKTAQCQVTVSAKVNVTGIDLDKTSATVALGKNMTLTASIQPNNATDKNIIWRSSNDAVATVDQTGRITGVKEGSAIITATTEDGNITKQCEVTVVVDECFIATAAYVSKFQPSVELLRHFRDDYLLTNNLGASFVKFYYKNSPPIAKFIAHNAVLKNVVKLLMTPFVGVVYGLYNPVLAGSLLLVLIMVTLIIRKYRPQVE